MKTWKFVYKGTLKSSGRKGGAGFTGTHETRALTVEEALEKFYAVFNISNPNRSFFIQISSITSED